MLFLIYVIAGYWAAGVVLYEGKIVFYSFGQLFMQKLIWGAILGFILIPIAIGKRILMS